MFMEKGRVVCDDSPQAAAQRREPRITEFLKDVNLVPVSA